LKPGGFQKNSKRPLLSSKMLFSPPPLPSTFIGLSPLHWRDLFLRIFLSSEISTSVFPPPLFPSPGRRLYVSGIAGRAPVKTRLLRSMIPVLSNLPSFFLRRFFASWDPRFGNIFLSHRFGSPPFLTELSLLTRQALSVKHERPHSHPPHLVRPLSDDSSQRRRKKQYILLRSLAVLLLTIGPSQEGHATSTRPPSADLVFGGLHPLPRGYLKVMVLQLTI